MNDSATPSRTARIVDALAQAERIEQLIRDARDVELSDRPTASQLLDEAIAATRELPDLHELHAVGAFPTPAEFAEQLAGAGSIEIDLGELGGGASGLGAGLGEIPAASAGMTGLERGCGGGGARVWRGRWTRAVRGARCLAPPT